MSESHEPRHGGGLLKAGLPRQRHRRTALNIKLGIAAINQKPEPVSVPHKRHVMTAVSRGFDRLSMTQKKALLPRLNAVAAGDFTVLADILPHERDSGEGFGTLVSLAEGQASLAAAAKKIPMEEWAGPVMGASGLQRAYGISRSTLHYWQTRKSVIGFLKGTRNYVFPVEQFVDGRPVEGLKEVVETAGRDRTAWLWLRTSRAILNGRRPLDLLANGELGQVIEVATQDFG